MSEREILFRGKEMDNGEWVYGFYIEDELSEGMLVPSIIQEDEKGAARYNYEGYNIEIRVIPETVGQFTGLVDKNGTRIFEGDIVEYEGERYSINYLTHYARFSAVKPKTVFCVFAYQLGEVIGNIHDNPELLKGERENDN